MIDWLLAPIDPSRAHDISTLIAWHSRAMVLAWGFMVPIGVLAARFYKILPGQDWPRELDSKPWWITHRVLHYAAGVLTLWGIYLVASGLTHFGSSGTHGLFGWSVVVLVMAQILGGWLRGTKGGPTDLAPDGSLRGDHYDMTPRRLAFEYLHKTGGYLAILVACCAIISGLWRVNAPVWMPLTILGWWMFLMLAFVRLQRQNRAVDTYQAIWGPDHHHPGNARRPIGIGINRRGPRSSVTHEQEFR